MALMPIHLFFYNFATLVITKCCLYFLNLDLNNDVLQQIVLLIAMCITNQFSDIIKRNLMKNMILRVPLKVNSGIESLGRIRCFEYDKDTKKIHLVKKEFEE